MGLLKITPNKMAKSTARFCFCGWLLWQGIKINSNTNFHSWHRFLGLLIWQEFNNLKSLHKLVHQNLIFPDENQLVIVTKYWYLFPKFQLVHLDLFYSKIFTNLLNDSATWLNRIQIYFDFEWQSGEIHKHEFFRNLWWWPHHKILICHCFSFLDDNWRKF